LRKLLADSIEQRKKREAEFKKKWYSYAKPG